MPCTWNNGLPWRELRGKLFCRCRVSEVVPMECWPCMPSLGQGMVEYWNVGLDKEVTHFIASLSREILPIYHYSIFLEPIIFTP